MVNKTEIQNSSCYGEITRQSLGLKDFVIANINLYKNNLIIL